MAPPEVAAGPSEVGHGRTHAWTRLTPLRTGPVASVAVDETDPDLVVAAGEDGAAWLSLDGGGTWYRILDPVADTLSDDEDLLVQVEAHVADVLELPEEEVATLLAGEDDGLEGAEDLVEQVRDVADAIASDIRADIQSQPWLLGDDVDPRGRRRAAPRVSLTNGHSEIWVGRRDGLWLSQDVGTTWRQVLDLPAGPVIHLPQRRLWVAGTADGLRYAADPLRFIDPEDGTEDLVVFDLALAPEGTYAGTDDGLWYAPDAQAWIPTGPTGDPVFAVLPDPVGDRGLWVATAEGVFRSDDRGLTFRAPPDVPLSGTRDLLWLGPGRLFAATSEGPWESLDGGGSWTPASRGLVEPGTAGLAGGPGRILLASAEGVFRLEPRAAEPAPPAGPDAEPAGWIPTGALVDAALGRRGLQGGRLSGGLRRAATILPQVRVEARYEPDRALSYNAAAGTSRQVQGGLFGWIVLEWTPDGRKRSGALTSMVLDGDVFIDDGQDRAMLTARVLRNGTTYRTRVAERVVALATARRGLVARSPALAGASLADRVEHALRILEIDAKLDALTDGYVSRSRLAVAESTAGDSP